MCSSSGGGQAAPAPLPPPVPVATSLLIGGLDSDTNKQRRLNAGRTSLRTDYANRGKRASSSVGSAERGSSSRSSGSSAGSSSPSSGSGSSKDYAGHKINGGATRSGRPVNR